jgi:hypothetical protein
MNDESYPTTADIRCISGAVKTVKIGDFDKCSNCGVGLSVTVIKDWRGRECLDPVVTLPAYPGRQRDWLREHKRLGYPVKHKRPELVDWS